jgi:hypothetical protein
MFNRAVKFANKNLLTFFLLSLLFVKLPPFNFFPFWQTEFFTSHSIARLLSIFLFLHFFFRDIKSGNFIHSIKGKSVLIFFSIYFLFSTLSIINARNLESFFLRYKDVVFAGIFAYIAYNFRSQRNKIIKFFILSSIINFTYQIFMFILPGTFLSFANVFIYAKHIDLVAINLQRNRIFIETYDEIVIPFVFLYFYQNQDRVKKGFFYLLMFLIAFPSLLSNFRSRIVMLVFAFFTSFFLLLKKSIGQKFILMVIFVATGFFAYSILQYNFEYSFIDRFALQNQREDINTIFFRFKNLIWSEDMANTSPFLGVGLGNYYDNLPVKKLYHLSLMNWENKESEIAASNPHNIFALIISETGYINFLVYLIMLIYFVMTDLQIIFNKKNVISISFIISFWTLFIYSLVNPTTTYTYNLLFWTLRVLII